MNLDFDLVDVALFINIAETNSLTHGSERSFLSVPAASTRIKNIEDRLGLKLLYRNRLGVDLTPAGETFLFHSRLLMQQIEQLRGELQEYSRGVKGHLRLLASTASITEFLPPIVKDYLARHPDVNVDLRERLSQDIVRAITEGSADIGLVADVTSTGNLQVFPYRNYRHVLATSATHPLASEVSVSFERTLDYDFIGPGEGSVMHAFLKQAADRCNKTLKTRIQVGNFEVLCRLIEGNIGVGVLPEPCARRYAESMRIQIVELEDEWAVRKLLICVRDLKLLPVFAVDLMNMLTADAASVDSGA
ncbi:MAG: LysR substrate-binding domain-containing protein [Candidatus Sulfotelmatobacter sp.]|jgi:DNA-binding transcriptional LysR family regulator